MSKESAEQIKLLVMDLDGTLLPGDGQISPRTIAAIRAARDLGVHTTIASGRNVSSFLHHAKQIGVNGPLLGMQGAIAREIPKEGEEGLGALLREVTFPSDLGARAIEWCSENGLLGHAVIRELYLFDTSDHHRESYERWFGPGSIERIEAIDDLTSHLARKRLEISKVVAHAPAGHPEASLDAARAAFGANLDVTISHPEYLEFTAPGVNKGSGVRWLADRLGISLAQTMAIGDQHNDLEMIEAVGHGVAMGSAPEAVRAAARYVAPTVEEDGAARMIERLILGSGGE